MSENLAPGEVYDLKNREIQYKKQIHDQETAIKRLTVQLRIREQALSRAAAKGKQDGTTKGAILSESVLDKSALAEQDAELEALRKKNRQLAERLRNVEIHVVAKAQAQNRTVPYGDRPSKTRPYAVGIHTPAEIASGKGASRGGSRASSSERKQIEVYGATTRSSVGGTPRTAARGSSVGALPPPVPGGHSSSSSSNSRSPGGVGGLDTTNAETRILTEQRDAARAEADSLRRQISLQLSTSNAISSSGSSGGANASYSHLPVGSGNTVAVPRNDLLEMERQLKDRTSQVLLLKSRYEHLESRAAAERELYDRAVAALEEQNSQIRDARSGLQQAEADISLLRSRLRAQEDNDSELRNARDEVRRMERQLTDLCESPFISDGRERLGKAEKLEDLQKESAALKEQVSHLQHSVKSQHIEITALRREKRELTDSNESLKEQSSQSRQLAEAAQRANATLRERLALYSGVVGGMDGTASAGTAIEGGPAVSSSSGSGGGGSNAVPPEELERALAIVRRRMDTPASDTGAKNDSDASNGDLSASTGVLRRKVQQLQLALLSTQRDLERSEAMLRAQSSISADLSAEVAELNERISTETGSIRRRLADTEAVAEKRLQRTSMLEAQVKQLLQKLRDVTEAYSTSKAALEEALIAAKEAAETRAVNDATGAVSTLVGATATAGGASSSHATMSRRQPAAARGALSPRALEDGGDDDDDASTVISDLSGDDDRVGIPVRTSTNNKKVPSSSSSSSSSAADDTGLASSSALATTDDETTEDDSLGELLDFGPGEDAIEIYIVDATIDPSALGRHDTTFALLDFLDFDSQTSPLSNGPVPIYNFSAAYRVETTQAFLHSIASQGATIDINQAKGADFELLARAVVPLYDFLLPPLPTTTIPGGAPAPKPTTRLRFATLPLMHKNGRVIGSLRVEARIAVPLTELWAQFNRERPAEGASLTQQIREKQRTSKSSGGVTTALSMDASSSSSSSSSASAALVTSAEISGHKPNELLVTIVGASDLVSRRIGGGAPSTFVQFNLPGMSTAATSIVSSNSNPVYADQRVFPLVPNARQLQTLGSSPLVFSVIDDTIASAAATTGSSGVGSAVIGKATVSLAAVAEGGSIDSSYDLTDSKGQITGRLHIRIGWGRPLSTVDGAPPGTLYRAQLHALSAIFDKDGAGVKHELLARAILMSEDDANSLDRVRKAVDTHERALVDASASSSSSSRRASVGNPVKWSTALKTAAEACGRPGLTLSPKEVFTALSLPAVSGMTIDSTSIENALFGLLPPLKDGESSTDDKLPVNDIIDAFSPLPQLAYEAFGKLRRFAAGLPKGKGQPRLDWALEDEADDAAKLVFKTERPTRAQAERLSRSGVIQALKKIGIMIVDDASLDRRSSATTANTNNTAASRASEKAAADQLTAAVAAAVALETPGRDAGSGVTVRIASREEEVVPSIVSAAIANATSAATAAATIETTATVTTVTIENQTISASRRASAKELVFDSNTSSGLTVPSMSSSHVAENIVTTETESAVGVGASSNKSTTTDVK